MNQSAIGKLMTDFYQLQPRQWAGITEAPSTSPGSNSSPVLITKVKPLKTGQGLLQIEFIQPLHKGGSKKRSIVVKVVQKTATHLACLMEDKHERQAIIFAEPTFAWLESSCPELMRRRPRKGTVFIIDGEAVGEPTWQEHLGHLFGQDAESALTGTTKKSFKVKLPKMPKQYANIMVNRELEPFDSCLAARGFCPREMEDKWFIYYEDQKLIFRRSWTGIMIYSVEAYWRADRLYLGHAYANRKENQYGETDDNQDEVILKHIINDLLLGTQS